MQRIAEPPGGDDLTNRLSVENVQLRDRLAENNRRVQDLTAQLAASKAATDEARHILASRGWALLERLRRLRTRLVPPGSRRAKFARSTLRAARRVVKTGHEFRQRFVGGSEVISARVPASLLPEPRHRSDVVNILTATFFNFDGEDMYCGGAERYLLELARLIRRLGYRPAVYQRGNRAWVRRYQDLEVRGIVADEDAASLNAEFHRQVPCGALTIYSAFHLAAPQVHPHSLGISHGVWWDQDVYHESDAAENLRRSLLQAVFNCTQLVSVDTNTINWVRTVAAGQGAKFHYVPNFVATEVFCPPSAGRARDGRLVVLYPRRLYPPRGFWLLCELVPWFCERYPEVEFHFVGKGDRAEIEAVQDLHARYGQRVQWYHAEPDEMHLAYRQADIAVIPTVASEGTSLSCLEAMASGCAVIATDVGGLPDLVLDGHNGLLIPPKASALRTALQRLVEDAELRGRLQARAREVSLCFSAEIWQARWMACLAEMLPARTPHAPREDGEGQPPRTPLTNGRCEEYARSA